VQFPAIVLVVPLLLASAPAAHRGITEADFVARLVEKCVAVPVLPGVGRGKPTLIASLTQALQREPRWKKIEGGDKLERLEAAGRLAHECRLVVAIDPKHAAVVVDEETAAGSGMNVASTSPATPRKHGVGTWVMRGGEAHGLLPLQHAFPNLETVEYYLLTGHCGCQKPQPEPCALPPGK
jgi:hypothetical protein